MKKILSAILLLCCFATLGVFLYLRANAVPPQPATQTEEPPLEAAPAVDENLPVPQESPAQAEEEPVEAVGPAEITTPEPEAPAPAVESIDYAAAYAPVFDSYRLWLSGFEPTLSGGTDRGDYYLTCGEVGVSFLCRYVDTLGYAFVDMDSNGIAELLIGSEHDEHQQKFIYDMFTLVDGVPQRVLVSSERVFYKLCPDHQIFHHGSGGAAYNFEVIYNYSGTDLVMTSGVVNAGDDVYYEIVGETENIFDERLPGDTPITREEYLARAEAMDAATIPLQLQPLA